MEILFQKIKKSFAGLLILAITTPLFIHPITARAQAKEATIASAAVRCVGLFLPKPEDALGELQSRLDPSKVPTRDVDIIAATKRIACQDLLDKALALLTDTLREVLRKRILDAMVDQTINWIQGGGSPRFVTDFGGALEDAAQAAVGDVARGVGLGNLCTGIPAARIQFQLETPVFSQRVSCTLDDIVGNIGRFSQNFTSGGFIGYQELLKPQNNRWGIETLALSELERRTAQKQDALRQEIAVGSGFLSTTQCLEWTLFASIGGRVEQLDAVPVNDAFGYPDPKSPPPTLDNTQQWKCTKSQVSTPGRLIADATTNALNIHSNFLVNAEDLSGYAAAIIDAGINRIIKEGFKGILGVPVSAPPTGFRSSADLPGEITEAAATYTDTQQEQGGAGVTSEDLLQAVSATEQSLVNAKTAFENALVVNDNASTTANSFLDWCRTTTSPGVTNASLHPQSCATASQIFRDTETNETEFKNRIEEIDDRAEEIPSLRTAAANPPTDTNQLQALVNRITGFAQNASLLETTASSQLSNIQAVLQQITNLLNACTDNDEITQCP